MELENNNLQNLNTMHGGGDGGFSSACCCIRKLRLIVVLLFAVLILVIGIAWFVMNPHDPGFQLTSLSVTNFTVSDSKLTGDYRIELTVINPNKIVQVLLDRVNIRVCYGEVELSETTVNRSPTALATYQLQKMSERNLTFWLESRGPPPKMKHKKVSGDLSADLKKGVVNFNVKVQLGTKFAAGNWPNKEKFLDVYCGDLDVFFSDKAKGTGKLLGVGKDCRISSQY